MGLSRCPRVAWQRQAQNLSMNMLAHTSTENHQSPLYSICYFPCSTGGWIPDLGHTVQVPYHWPIAPALHNSSSGYARVGQWDSSVEKGCLLPNLTTWVQFPENQLPTLFSDFHMCPSMCTYTITGAQTRAHTHITIWLWNVSCRFVFQVFYPWLAGLFWSV